MSIRVEPSAIAEPHEVPLDLCEANVIALKELVVHLSGARTDATTAAMIVHEVAQPLTAATIFLSAADHLLSGGDPDATSQGLQALHEAQQCLARTGEVMKSVQDAAACKTFDPSPQQLDDIVAGVLQLFEFDATLIPSIALSPTAMRVMGDGAQLGQVICNLVRNAVEATEGQAVRRVRITSRRADRKFIEVRIEDNGPGISERMEGLLFSAFSSTKSDGAGVGLSVCRAIIEQHHGRIWADALPDGTAFSFTVPSCAARRKGALARPHLAPVDLLEAA